jgi:hypothetical protein
MKIEAIVEGYTPSLKNKKDVTVVCLTERQAPPLHLR